MLCSIFSSRHVCLFILFLSLLATTELIRAESRLLVSNTQTVRFLDFTAQVPTQWQSRIPGSSMRLLEFSSESETKESANILVYYFGQGQGGSADANIIRWRSQFSLPSQLSPPEPTITRFKIQGMAATLAEFSGNYARGIGAGPGGSGLIGYSLIAAIVESPRGNLIYQLWGPEEIVQRRREGFINFVKTTRIES